MRLPKRRKLAVYTLDDIAAVYPDIRNDLDTPEKLAKYYGISISESVALEFVSRCLYLHNTGDKKFIAEAEEQFQGYLGQLVLSGFVPPTLNKSLNK